VGKVVGCRAGEGSRILPADRFNRAPDHDDAQSEYARDAGANHDTAVTVARPTNDDTAADATDRATAHDATTHDATTHHATTHHATDDDAHHDASEWGRGQLLRVGTARRRVASGWNLGGVRRSSVVDDALTGLALAALLIRTGHVAPASGGHG
jgi:hypothetical protein